MHKAPLGDLLVIELGQYIAAPGTTQLLADMGATVVKIEPPGGDQTRHAGKFGEGMFYAFNRGKHSIELDLKEPDDQSVARRLLETADVFIQNLRPGAAQRLSVAYEDVREVNDQIVYATISGFGDHRAEDRPRPGLDIVAQAESGMMAVTGEADGDPLRVGFPVVDTATTFALAYAIMTALHDRQRTGLGTEVSIALLDVALHLQLSNWGEFGSTGVEPTRSGNGQQWAAPAAELISTADGYIVVSAYSDHHWARLCQLIDRPEMITDIRFATSESRVDHREQMRSAMEAFFRQQDRGSAVRALTGIGIPSGVVRGYQDVLDDLAPEHAFLEVESFDGAEMRLPPLPFTVGGFGGTRSGEAPLLDGGREWVLDHVREVDRDRGSDG